MKYQRLIDLSLIEHKSLFLFGPRQTGKSFLLKERYPKAPYYDLLKSDLFLKFSKFPHLLREELLAQKIQGPVIIDEIQKIPILLDEVHHLIEAKGMKFILTGSSARKLKRGGANLLAGRALKKNLYPLTYPELLNANIDLDKIINFGKLPAILNSKIAYEELVAYVGTYLKEEVYAESLVRNLEPFSQFLDLVGLSNTEMVSYTNISSDLGVSAKTVKEYYTILEDTLLGELLSPFTKTIKRKPTRTPKFYLFDIGVANILGQRIAVKQKSEAFGKCFEHFIYTELRAYLDYHSDLRKLTFWRSKNHQEVDFLIGDSIAIEVKGTTQVQKRHLKGLQVLSEEINLKHKIVVSLDSAARLIAIDGDEYHILPYQIFLEKLWNHEFGRE